MLNRKLLFGVLILAVIFVDLHSYIYLNETDPIFPPNVSSQSESSESLLGGRDEIRGYLVQGAAQYIQSYTEALRLLNEYELSSADSLNYSVALMYCNTALKALETSKENFESAIAIAENLEYVEAYRIKLLAFNYDSYISENRLNSVIAGEVKGFLENGDMIGLYRKNLEKIDSILAVLSKIYKQLNSNKRPGISEFWSLYQKYSETALFGNYASVLSKEAFN